jgi:hypothetical protein
LTSTPSSMADPVVAACAIPGKATTIVATSETTSTHITNERALTGKTALLLGN